MRDLKRIRDYAEYLLDRGRAMQDDLNYMRKYYLQMITDGALIYDYPESMDDAGGYLDEINKNLWLAMKGIAWYLADLPEDEEKEGEEDGEV
jgi:hypothetical protein